MGFMTTTRAGVVGGLSQKLELAPKTASVFIRDCRNVILLKIFRSGKK